MKKHVQQALDEELVLSRASDMNDPYASLRVRGRDALLEHIADGTFTSAYLFAEEPHGVFVLTDETSDDKEILAAVHRRLPENPHVPAVTPLGVVHSPRGSVMGRGYTMPYYETHETSPYVEEERAKLYACERAHRRDTAGVLRCAQERHVAPQVVEAMAALNEEAGRRGYGFVFDFDKYNVGTDAQGRLVLLDVLYPSNSDDSGYEE